MNETTSKSYCWSSLAIATYLFHDERMTDDGWRKVAAAVKARRLELGLTQEEAAEVAGKSVSYANWRVIEKARRGSYRPATVLGVCSALDWTSDSIDRIRDGLPAIVLPATGFEDDGEIATLVDQLINLATEIGRRVAERS